MTTSPGTAARDLAPCRFRRAVDAGSSESFSCRLVERICADVLPCVISRDECENCQMHGAEGLVQRPSQSITSAPELDAPLAINSHIASLVVRSARAYLGGLAADAAIASKRRVLANQAIQFALPSLIGDCDDNVRPWDEEEMSGDPADARIADRYPHVADTRQLRLGLVGPADGYGVAQQNRGIAKHLPVSRWLMRSNPGPGIDLAKTRVDVIGRQMGHLEMEAWLADLDVVLFVERPCFYGLTAVAQSCGVAVVCVPNWEWLHPGLDWLPDVDLMLCPTRHTAGMLQEWKIRFGFDWRLETVPWPIDVARFPYRRRCFCRRFVYIHGSGGVEARAVDKSGLTLRRKGWETLRHAAERLPRVPFIVYAERELLGAVPSNVSVRPQPVDNRELYEEGDVCVQPSVWEGLGLPLLECQASGMPLITTDSAPMNEHQALAVVPVTIRVAASLDPEICITAAIVDREALADVLGSHHRRWIGAASRSARRYVEQTHDWRHARTEIIALLNSCLQARSATVT